MAAPQIPNLLSLRGGSRGTRGGRGGRGGSSGLGVTSKTPEQLAAHKDRLIQATDTDASYSRLSAVNAGYLKDQFAKEFVLGDIPKRFPIINRGIPPILSSPPAPTQTIYHADIYTRIFRHICAH
jgi:[phosphatase 2A protein]-leucine-carboxy methyltransferase